MIGVPPSTGRVHPLVVAKIASDDKDFTRNYLSGSTSLSLKTVLLLGGAAIGLVLALIILS